MPSFALSTPPRLMFCANLITPMWTISKLLRDQMLFLLALFFLCLVNVSPASAQAAPLLCCLVGQVSWLLPTLYQLFNKIWACAVYSSPGSLQLLILLPSSLASWQSGHRTPKVLSGGEISYLLVLPCCKYLHFLFIVFILQLWSDSGFLLLGSFLRSTLWSHCCHRKENRGLSWYSVTRDTGPAHLGCPVGNLLHCR